jgi:hypothetical protein
MPGGCACFALNYYTGKLFMFLLLMHAVDVCYAPGTVVEKGTPLLVAGRLRGVPSFKQKVQKKNKGAKTRLHDNEL